jgi:hypothetical protein
VVDELRRLHEPGVMHALLGAAALAPLRQFAAPKSRPVIWLLGLTGTGKTFLAKLFMGFFGDFPLDACGRIATWNATDNSLQSHGFYYKDCLAVLDDFKPEMIRHRDVVRFLQNAADGTGRGRLRHDMRARATRPVRGQILATGEDLPAQNASGLARSIIVEVPNREKDLELGGRCAAMSPLYRGLMADFLAWVIREGRGAVFADRVEHWQRHYCATIAGRQNDARIAGNHRLLAAAFEQMAAYLRDVGPGRSRRPRSSPRRTWRGWCRRASGRPKRTRAARCSSMPCGPSWSGAESGSRGRAARAVRRIAGRSWAAPSRAP